MAENDDNFLASLLAIFTVEAKEHLNALSAGLVELEKTTDPHTGRTLIEKLYREAHSLKGAARSVRQTNIEAACQNLENRLASIKHQETELTQDLFDQLLQTVSRLQSILPQNQTGLQTSVEKPLTRKNIARPENAPIPPASNPYGTTTTSQHIRDDNTPTPDTVRIASAKLDTLLLQVEEMLTAKLFTQQRQYELAEIDDLLDAWAKTWANESEKYRNLFAVAGNAEFGAQITERHTVFFKTLQHRLRALRKNSARDHRLLAKSLDDMLNGMKEALMLPFSTLTETYPVMAREFAAETGKTLNLTIRGGEIKADRRVLEEIKNPLLHLFRNSIDHGIETPETRHRLGKPSGGTITITFRLRDNNRVEIVIADDGAGIDIDRIKTKAEKLGLLSPEQIAKLDSQQCLELVYQSGLSTSAIITEMSGRGLGLAIVQEKVDKLGGSIRIETAIGKGTSFHILLPLMFATYQGLLIRIGEHLFVLPAANTERVLRVKISDVLTLENREAINPDGTVVSLVRLDDVLNIPRRDEHRNFLHVLLLTASGKRIAFIVDEVISQQEVVVKNLGKQLIRVRNITGATILGSGKAVPVLNVSDLMKSAQASAVNGLPSSAAAVRQDEQKKSVLVVEDSVTARSLLKSILESAGYRVVTAVDGLDGLNRLQNEDVAIVVSDVEMPRMNGFELTAKIRGNKKLAELPVVLVTALASREHREHGIEVGANAYIEKKSFEHDNLLDIVRRLV